MFFRENIRAIYSHVEEYEILINDNKKDGEKAPSFLLSWKLFQIAFFVVFGNRVDCF